LKNKRGWKREYGAGAPAVIGICLLIAIVAWQVYLGATFKKVGIPSVFEIEFGSAKTKLCMAEDVGFDRYGTKGTLDVDRQANTPRECEKICLNDERCQAVSYHLSSKQCWIKDSIPLRVPNPDYVSAVKSACP
jgi:hypothetical protein